MSILNYKTHSTCDDIHENTTIIYNHVCCCSVFSEHEQLRKEKSISYLLTTRGALLLATDRQETYVPDYPIYRLSISSKPFLSPDGISSILPVLSSSSLFAHQLSLFFYAYVLYLCRVSLWKNKSTNPKWKKDFVTKNNEQIITTLISTLSSNGQSIISY
jgi:hypothetical protein